ncbi:MAG: glutaredoxin [Pseudomonadota bacterium]
MTEIEIFTGANCSYCDAAKALLSEHKLAFLERDMADPSVRTEFRTRLPRERSIPQIFIDGEHIGGFEDLKLRLG